MTYQAAAPDATEESPRSTSVHIAGEYVTIERMRVRKMARAIAMWGPILERYGPSRSPDVMFANGVERILDIIQLAAGREQKWLDELEWDDELRNLWRAILTVNPPLARWIPMEIPELAAPASPVEPSEAAAQ